MDSTDYMIEVIEKQKKQLAKQAEQLKELMEFVDDCSISHIESRYKYRAKLLVAKYKNKGVRNKAHNTKGDNMNLLKEGLYGSMSFPGARSVSSYGYWSKSWSVSSSGAWSWSK